MQEETSPRESDATLALARVSGNVYLPDVPTIGKGRDLEEIQMGLWNELEGNLCRRGTKR